MNMKYQVVLSAGVIFGTIFIKELQPIPSQLSIIYLKTSFYKLQTMLIFIGTVNIIWRGKLWPKTYLKYQILQGPYCLSLFDNP